jgi:hypothetical protein
MNNEKNTPLIFHKYTNDIAALTIVHFKAISDNEITFETQLALLGSGGVNNSSNPADRIGRKAALLGVLANHLFVGRIVYTINFVVGYIAMHPLNLRAHIA